MNKQHYAVGMLIDLCRDVEVPRVERESMLRHLVNNAQVSVSRDGSRVTLVFDADAVADSM